jgi:tetratricopeptide (TPR) repeat protein
LIFLIFFQIFSFFPFFPFLSLLSSPSAMSTPSIVESDPNLAKAFSLKEEGNAFVAQGDWRAAIAKYTKVFAWSGGLGKAGGEAAAMMQLLSCMGGDAALTSAEDQARENERKAACAAVQLSANLNLALCYLKLEDGARALKFARNALSCNPRPVGAQLAKAHSRAGHALLLLNDAASAESELQAALALVPGDVTTRRLLADAQAAQRRAEAELAKRMSSAF